MVLSSVDCENPYFEIDNANQSLMELENLYHTFHSQATLFEITLPDSNALESTKNTLFLIKQIWDFINLVKECIDVWKSTLWSNIDSEFIDMELKRFAKDLRGVFENKKCKLIIIILIIIISRNG